MKLEFFGAAQTVTGSKHLLTTDKGTKVLLDCGMFQGSSVDGDILNRHFGFYPADIDYVFLSHAHIDHSGLLPRLVREGFEGKIYATPATISLCEIMLADSAHIQQAEIKYVNQRRVRRNEPLLKPLYYATDVDKCLARFEPVEYDTWTQIDEEVSLLFTHSGHILGAAAVNMKLKNDKGKEVAITFTGDIGRPNDKILKPPAPFPQADYIICESTYGDRLHEPEPDLEAHLLRIVKETCVDNRGKLIIPAFSVDRTQEIIYALDRLEHEDKLPQIDVYLDSPLSVRATHIMNNHHECFNPEIIQYINIDGDAFGFPQLHYVSDVNESKAINDENGPAIIISASGMAEAGRIKHHIRNNIEDSRNTILIVGYCTPDSLGGQLRNGEKEVTIFGHEYPVKARVVVMDSFSAHGDYEEMQEYLACQDISKVKKLFLVHGEYETQEQFAVKLRDQGFKRVIIPEMGDEELL